MLQLPNNQITTTTEITLHPQMESNVCISGILQKAENYSKKHTFNYSASVI